MRMTVILFATLFGALVAANAQSAPVAISNSADAAIDVLAEGSPASEQRRSPEAGRLLQILVEPFEPDAVCVRIVDGIAGVMSGYGKGDEFHGDAVILERVVKRVGTGDGHSGVAGVVENQRGRGDRARIGDGRLFRIRFRVLLFPRRAAELEALGDVDIREGIPIGHAGDGGASNSRFPDVVMPDEP